MSHVIAYPDDLFQKISTYASKRGKTPEEVLFALAEREIVADDENLDGEGTIPDDDPFFALAGILHSGTPDLGVNHDAYLAETYADTHEKD